VIIFILALNGEKMSEPIQPKDSNEMQSLESRLQQATEPEPSQPASSYEAQRLKMLEQEIAILRQGNQQMQESLAALGINLSAEAAAQSQPEMPQQPASQPQVQAGPNNYNYNYYYQNPIQSPLPQQPASQQPLPQNGPNNYNNSYYQNTVQPPLSQQPLPQQPAAPQPQVQASLNSYNYNYYQNPPSTASYQYYQNNYSNSNFTSNPNQTGSYSPPGTPNFRVGPNPTYAPTSTVKPLFDGIDSLEWWLNKIGITLLLLGVAFLFTYSIQQGWFNKEMQVATGLATGGILMGFGLYTYPKRSHFGLVLMGGGIATFYITIFGGFQLYRLPSYPIAFGALVLITLTAIYFSLRQDEVVLAVIGIAGGLATPFIVHGDSGDMLGLVVYNGTIVSGAAAIYLYKGWKRVLNIAFIGNWMVLALGILQSARYTMRGLPDESFIIQMEPGSISNTIALQLGIGFSWLLFAVVAVLGEILAQSKRAPHNAKSSNNSAMKPNQNVRIGTAFTILLNPILALLWSAALWNVNQETAGVVLLTAAVLYALIALGLQNDYSELAYYHVIFTVAAGTLAVLVLLQNQADWLLLALTIETLIIHYLDYHYKDLAAEVFGHLLGVCLGYWLLVRLSANTYIYTYNTSSYTYIQKQLETNLGDWINLVVIAIIFAIGLMPKNNKGGSAHIIYAIAAYVALLGWLWRIGSLATGSTLTSSNSWVTLSWGLCAIVLIWGGWLLKRNIAIKFGIGTLLLAVAKLFFLDLESLDAVLRVLLFSGFGVVFLALSYFAKDIFPVNKPEQPPAPTPMQWPDQPQMQ
jgi:uncharacterized membrane protein